MNINFGILKLGFSEYLKSLNKESGNDTTSDVSDFNIFTHNKEFKEYVQQELNLKTNDINISLFDLGNMEVVNGELVPKGENSKSSSDKNPYDIVTELLNSAMKTADVFSKIDKNADGKLDKDEAENFFAFISKNDNNGDSVSIEDILVAMDEMKNGTYTGETTEVNQYSTDSDKSLTDNNVNNSSGDSSVSSSSTSSNYSDSYNSQTPEKTDDSSTSKPEEIPDYSKLSLEESITQRSSKETELQTVTQNINDIYLGKNSKVMAAEKELSEKELAYLTAVENDANIQQDLKTKINENNTSISEQEDSINNIKANISKKETEIFNKEAGITAINSDISALESSLETLSSQTTDDADTQAEIDNQIEIVKAQLEEKRNELKTEEAALKALESEKKGFETDLSTEEQKLESLVLEKNSLESQLTKNAGDETKTKLSEFNAAKENFNAVKAEELKLATTSADNVKTQLTAINQNINVKNSGKIQREHSVSSSKLFDENTEYETQYVKNGTDIPYLLIGPKDADPNEELPVLVYLHGSGERGRNENALLNVGPGKIMQEWDLTNFRGYIICPQLTDENANWNNEKVETQMRQMLNNFESTHAVNKDKVVIAGHSLGGIGAVYFADKMSDVFSRAAVLSGFSTNNVNLSDIKIPIKAYVGTSDKDGSRNFTKNEFQKVFGQENVEELKASHGGIPLSVLTEDTDGNGQSDFFEWLFADKID